MFSAQKYLHKQLPALALALVLGFLGLAHAQEKGEKLELAESYFRSSLAGDRNLLLEVSRGQATQTGLKQATPEDERPSLENFSLTKLKDDQEYQISLVSFDFTLPGQRVQRLHFFFVTTELEGESVVTMVEEFEFPEAVIYKNTEAIELEEVQDMAE